MSQVHVTYDTTASPIDCWALMADFANIDAFNPHVRESRLLAGSPAAGIGTTRQCDLGSGKGFIREKVIDWREGRSYTVDIYEGTMPVDNTVTTLGLTPLPNGGTQLYMKCSYQTRWGLLGRVLDPILLRPLFSRMFKGVLVGLAGKAATKEQAPTVVHSAS